MPTLNKTWFSVLALFFVGAAGFTLLDQFRGYEAEVSILVIPASDQRAAADQIVENIAVLPTTVSFFDALLASDERLTEHSDFDAQSAGTRAATWKRMLSVERQGTSGVITYTIHAQNQEEAALLARQMATALFQKIGVYYDIRTEVSLRLIEGPLVRSSITAPLTWITLSVVAGILLALVVTFLGALGSAVFSTTYRRSYSGQTGNGPQANHAFHSAETVLPTLHPNTFVPKKPHVLFSSEERQANSDKQVTDSSVETLAPPPASSAPMMSPVQQSAPSAPKLPVRSEQPAVGTPDHARSRIPTFGQSGRVTQSIPAKASAPANLPFMDEATFLAQFQGGGTTPAETTESQTVSIEMTKEPESVQDLASNMTPMADPTPIAAAEEPAPVEEAASSSVPSEPTVEEYRRRLNALLHEGR